jgi:hypothetical protein
MRARRFFAPHILLMTVFPLQRPSDRGCAARKGVCGLGVYLGGRVKGEGSRVQGLGTVRSMAFG